MIQQRFFATVQVDPAYSDSNHFRATGFNGTCGFLSRFVFTGAYDQP